MHCISPPLLPLHRWTGAALPPEASACLSGRKAPAKGQAGAGRWLWATGWSAERAGGDLRLVPWSKVAVVWAGKREPYIPAHVEKPLHPPHLQLHHPILPPLHHLKPEPVKDKRLPLGWDHLRLVDHQTGNRVRLIVGQVPVHRAV